MESSNEGSRGRMKRRDMLKGLASIPVLGVFFLAWWRKRKRDHYLNNTIIRQLDINASPPPSVPPPANRKLIRLGHIGYGIRGEQVTRAAGFAHPDVIDDWKKGAMNNPQDKRYEDYLAQEDLGIEIRGICDIYDMRAERDLMASGNVKRQGSEANIVPVAKRYANFLDLLAADDIDAVILTVPDHWHAPMAIAAAKAGKHVYVEKAMTHTVEEAFEMRKAVKESGIILQLGHQGRQTESYKKAKEVIDKGILGKISLIELCTNRNSPNGAWVYHIDEGAGPDNIDWQQFLGNAPQRPFSLERFFRWRCWWDYGTGLSGDLFTHEYDAMNQILDLGIPHSVVSSGGIYYYKDGREVPDVWQANCEYPERDLTLMYSATLASDRNRGKVIMGHDANMEIGNTLTVWTDPESTRYRDMLKSGLIDPSSPLFTYVPGKKNVDALASATEAYFAGRGLLYTYSGGRRVDTTYLHVREWLDCIRKGKQPSCNIDKGFQEAITAHMATISYRENRKVTWDPDKEEVM